MPVVEIRQMNLQKNGERRMSMEELLKGQARIEAQFQDINEKVNRLEDAVWGNGKPGINQRLALIEEHLERIDKWGEIFMKVSLPILLGILLLGITAFIQSVK